MAAGAGQDNLGKDELVGRSCAVFPRSRRCATQRLVEIESLAAGTHSNTVRINMAGSSRTTFAKRQKERARQEKQAEKAQRRAQRKQLGDSEGGTLETQSIDNLIVTHDEDGQPQGFDFHDFGK
jgi:hypothetical protein